MSDLDRRIELLKRKREILQARSSLRAWCQGAGYEPATHHQLIIDKLEALERGEIERLMIFMPPGSAKSTYGSLLFPPWYMARHPEHNVMTASHTMNLARRFGRRTRNMVQGHPDELGITVRSDNASADRWQIDSEGSMTEGGEYMAAGVDTGIAGFRSDLTVIDDPVKGRKEAESEVVRQGIWDWWVFDVRPRLKPGGKVVLIMTRWHEDDLAGRILAEEADAWTVLRLPMEADSVDDPLGRAEGERLWPEWFTDKMVKEAKQDAYLWLSLYQQSPSRDMGTYWQHHWFRPVEPGRVPDLKNLSIYGGSDYATKEGKGDYTVHVIVGIDPDGRPWLLDLWRAQTTSDFWVAAWCDMVLDWKPMAWGEEKGQILGGVGPWLQREALKRKAFTLRQEFASVADKSIMGRSMQAMIANTGLWYDRTAPWAKDFVNELMAFPTGKYDDQHDALSKIGMLLDMAQPGRQTPKANPKNTSGYKAYGATATAPNLKVL